MRKVTQTGIGLVVVIYLLVANAGYIAFGANTSSLLHSFTKQNIGTFFFIIVNCAFLISSSFVFPLMFFGAKNNVYAAILQLRKQTDKTSKDVTEENLDDEDVIEKKYGFGPVGRVGYILMLYGIVVVIAVFLPGINDVFDFVGSTAANGLNLLLPSMFYLKLASKKGNSSVLPECP
jgi:amino acid permease